MQASCQAILNGARFSELSIEDIERLTKAIDQKDLLPFAKRISKKLDELYKV